MRLLPLCLMLLLAACQLTLPGGGAKAPAAAVSANPILGDAIAVSPLDAPRPEPKPAAPSPVVAPEVASDVASEDAPKDATQTAPVAEPVVRKSPEQIACEKTSGTWAQAGKTGTMLCVRTTRDSGKQCRKGTDCDGLCLARSGTCAPIKPLFGCNEILQDDGRRVTLCID